MTEEQIQAEIIRLMNLPYQERPPRELLREAAVLCLEYEEDFQREFGKNRKIREA